MSKRRGKRRGFRLRPDVRDVAILTPCDDRVATDYAMSLVSMLQHTYANQPGNLRKLSVQTFGSTILPFSREQLALYALSIGATHTLWIDSDMRFPKDTLLRMLRSDDQIIGINAMSRRAPFRNCAQIRPGVPLETTADSSGFEKVHRMGFGLVWIATDVFRAMPRPFFDFEYVPDQEVWRGEDFAFFERARELGIPFYVDQDLSKEVFHMGAFGYNPTLLVAPPGDPAADAEGKE